jgi:hypothetical protein
MTVAAQKNVVSRLLSFGVIGQTAPNIEAQARRADGQGKTEWRNPASAEASGWPLSLGHLPPILVLA